MKKKQILVLIGPRCSGKSSVGEALASALGLPCYDTDAMLARASGLSVAEYINQKGWNAFRQQESALLREAMDAAFNTGALVCPGGGAVLSEENRAQIGRGLVIYLEAPLPVLLSRLHADGEKEARPALMGEDAATEFADVLAFREPLYRQCAAYTVDAAPAVEVVAAAIARLALAHN